MEEENVTLTKIVWKKKFLKLQSIKMDHLKTFFVLESYLSYKTEFLAVHSCKDRTNVRCVLLRVQPSEWLSLPLPLPLTLGTALP